MLFMMCGKQALVKGMLCVCQLCLVLGYVAVLTLDAHVESKETYFFRD